jgi:hypothetical protein
MMQQHNQDDVYELYVLMRLLLVDQLSDAEGNRIDDLQTSRLISTSAMHLLISKGGNIPFRVAK